MTYDSKFTTFCSPHYWKQRAWRIRELVEAGRLMSYGVNTPDSFRRAATYSDKILKGQNPRTFGGATHEIRVCDKPSKRHKTAKQIGLTIPLNVLVRVDRVIR